MKLEGARPKSLTGDRRLLYHGSPPRPTYYLPLSHQMSFQHKFTTPNEICHVTMKSCIADLILGRVIFESEQQIKIERDRG
jgi:hypothetical protein